MKEIMTLSEAIDARHSVRAYTTTPIPDKIRTQLNDYVADCNAEGNLNISIQYDDPAGFDSMERRLYSLPSSWGLIHVGRH